MSKENRDMSIEEKFQKWLKSEYQGFHTSNESEMLNAFISGSELFKYEFGAFESEYEEISKLLADIRSNYLWNRYQEDQDSMIASRVVVIENITRLIKELQEKLHVAGDLLQRTIENFKLESNDQVRVLSDIAEFLIHLEDEKLR